MTTIGRAIAITGDITSDEDLTIEGRVRGHVHLPREAALVIGTTGQIEGDLRGSTITILGHVKGGVSATVRIELAASAVVEGSLSANIIVVADGAWFKGGIDMGQRTIAAKIAQYKASQAAAATP